MADIPSPSDSSDGLTLLERFADQRLLVLLLCLVFYYDCWFISKELDPSKLKLSQLSGAVGDISLFAATLFVLSFALLMSVVSPGVRLVFGLIRVFLQANPYVERSRTKDRRQLSDWSLTFVLLVTVNLGLGLFANGYPGISIFLVNVFSSNSLGVVILRVSVLIFLVVCISRGMEIDQT